MEYERIERPQKGGGLSPAKLRNMLMGVDKKRRELLAEVDSSCSLRSQHSGVEDPGSEFPESFKDVDVVCEFSECSISTTENITNHKSKDQPPVNSKNRSNEELDEDYENGHETIGVVSSPFEFQKERGSSRVPPAPFSKPPPSKWDDAQKWIASPTSNRPKSGQSHGGQGGRKTNIFGNGGRKPATKVVLEVPEEKEVAFEEPDMKRMDSVLAKKSNGTQKLVGRELESQSHYDVLGKTAHGVEFSGGESTIHLSQHDSFIPIHTSTTTVIPPTSFARSVSMRDMGTEMTPLASQEPSRTGTPVKVKSPIHSPTSSRSSTPQRAHLSTEQTNMINDSLHMQRKELSEREMQMKTRKEIVELGKQLGKLNIAAWASKDDERATSSSMDVVGGEQGSKSVVETRAEAWEEAEKAKYMARFEREEMKIQAWENHQKAKTEAELRKIEVEVERKKAEAQDKLMKKLASTRHKADEKRAKAEVNMNKRAAKTEKQAEYIRTTGRLPSQFSCWSCCC